MTTRTTRRARKTRGQAIIEFTLAFMILGTLLAGVLEFGRLWNAANILNGAARDGARLAAITDKKDQRTQRVKDRVLTTAGSYFNTKDLSVQTTDDRGPNDEPLVRVTATGKMDMIFGQWLLGKNVNISRTVTMRDETVRQ